MSNITVNGQRLWSSLMDLARLGATSGGGVCRLALTDADRQGRDWLSAQARASGLDVVVDQVGNLFLRRPGLSNAAPVMVGSHIDSQPNGGRFDGTFGVLAGLEVCRALNEAGIWTQRPIEVAAWSNEEGSRFLPVMGGSGVFSGAYTASSVLEGRSSDGARFADELDRIGYNGPAAAGGRPVAAYFEAHIEQGPVLEARDCVIGVVSGVLGVAWFEVEIVGFEAHAGPVLMSMRRDALAAAAEVIACVESIGIGSGEGRTTIGMIDAWPNSRNVIPGRAKFSVDIRHTDADSLKRMVDEFKAAVQRICERRRVSFQIAATSGWPPMKFADALVSEVRKAALNRGYRSLDIVSGAGHDAVFMARICPTAMIFIPCKDGISHNEKESAEAEHVTAGANVLLDCVLANAMSAVNRNDA